MPFLLLRHALDGLPWSQKPLLLIGRSHASQHTSGGDCSKYTVHGATMLQLTAHGHDFLRVCSDLMLPQSLP